MKTKALYELVIAPDMQVRDINEQTVNKYVQALHAGAVFPPIDIEAGTCKVVCGNHRVLAMQKLLTPILKCPFVSMCLRALSTLCV